MVKTSLLERQAKVYLKIARRQLAMAEALLEKGFYEGAVFHFSSTASCPLEETVREFDKAG